MNDNIFSFKYEVKDDSNFKLENILVPGGRVTKSYWVIPNKLHITFQSLLNDEALNIREELMMKNIQDVTVNWNFYYMCNQVIEFGDQKFSNKNEAEEYLKKLPTPLIDRILNLFLVFSRECNELLDSVEAKDSSSNNETEIEQS